MRYHLVGNDIGTTGASMYTVHAYDKNDRELWISAGEAHIGAEPHIIAIMTEKVRLTYTLRTGRIVDERTHRPVVRRRNQLTGKRTTGSRRIAYFRSYVSSDSSGDTIMEIYVTKYGREAGVRDHQTRRENDVRTAPILGH